MITKFPHEFQTWRGETVIVTNPAEGHYHLEVEMYRIDWYQPPYSRTKVEHYGGGDFSRIEWEALQAFWQLMPIYVGDSKEREINFSDDDTTCPTCEAFGVYIPPYIKDKDGRVTATFECHNGHKFTKTYPFKDEV